MAHTQGKKHSTNLARRALKEKKDHERSGGDQPLQQQGQTISILHQPIPAAPQGSIAAVNAQIAAQKQQMHLMYQHLPIKKVLVKIGRPGYKVTKVCEHKQPTSEAS